MVVSDVVIQILLKLPPESLLRFKSVCKSWYALINDPKFVTKHLSNSLPYKHVLLKRIVATNSEKYEYALSILKFSLDRSVSLLDVHLPLYEDHPALAICGQSHSLVCLSDLCDIFLCNPMTRQFRKLPPSILIVRGHDPDDYYAHGIAVGFGYDAKSRNFKVVRVVNPWVGVVSHPSRVEIYDLSKDRWREIETPVYGNISITPSFEMYHEGTFYWWEKIQSFTQNTEHILTFDMSEEVFGKISVPESFDRQGNFRSLMVFNGSIVLFSYPYAGEIFDIWEMEKDEFAVVSWSKLLTIGPLCGIEFPLLFVNSDELLMESKEGQVVLYSIKAQQVKELPIKGENPHGWRTNRFEATFFIKSLLPVEGRNNISYEF